MWEDHASLKSCIEVIHSIELKQSHYEFLARSLFLQYLQSYLEIFICHLIAAMYHHFVDISTDNISPVCRYVVEIWPVFIKNHVLLARSKIKERSFIWAKNNGDFFPPSVEFWLVCPPRAGCVFKWAITQPVVCDDPWHLIDLLCIHALTLAHAFAADPYCVRPRARSRERELMDLSMRSCSYSLDIVWHWLEIARIQAKSLEKSRFSQILLGWSQRWSWMIPQVLSFQQHNLLIMMIY